MAAVEKRGESSYRLTVSCGYDKQGKKLMKRKTIDLVHIKPNKRDEEANKQWILFKDEIEKGLYFDSGKITFEDFIEKWLKDYAQVNLQPKTLLEYNKLLTRITAALGHIKLNQLQPTHLTEFYNNLRENGIRLDKKFKPNENFMDAISHSEFSLHEILQKANVAKGTLSNLKNHKNISQSVATRISEAAGLNINTLFIELENNDPLSEKTISHHHRLISSILTSALQWGFILNNPALRVKAPKVEKKEARHYNIEETDYILKLLENEPIKYRTMINLAIFGGMRQGELTALTWSDIDLKKGIVNIDKSLQHLPGKDTFVKSTKTENSRVISVPTSVITLLNEYKVWQNGEKAKLGDLWNKECNNIFTTIDGNPIFPSTISKWFLKFIRDHNEAIKNHASIPEEEKSKYLLREVNFHGLRHTSATLLINQNVDVSTVSKRLGHARTSTTMDIYSHSLQKADTEAADKLENLFKNNRQNKKES
jgi:integrase